MDSPEALLTPVEQADKALYRYSGLVDVLRDTAKNFLDADVGAAEDKVRQGLIKDYTRLRAVVGDRLPAEEATELAEWTQELGTDAHISEVFAAAATLAQFLDLFFNTDMFIAQRVQNRTSISTIMGARPLPTSPDSTAGTHTTPKGTTGQYL